MHGPGRQRQDHLPIGTSRSEVAGRAWLFRHLLRSLGERAHFNPIQMVPVVELAELTDDDMQNADAEW